MIMTNWSVVSDKTLQAVLKVCTVYGTSCHSNSVVSDFVCNLLRVLQQFNKILAKHSLVKNSWSPSNFVSFNFVLALVNKVSMATSNRLLSFYTLSLKLKLVCHLLFNGHEILSQASLVILLQKRISNF